MCAAGHHWEIESTKTRERNAHVTATIDNATRSVLVQRGYRVVSVRGFNFAVEGGPIGGNLCSVRDEAMKIVSAALAA